jgi:hypothetical protein
MKKLVWDTDVTTHFCPPDDDVEIKIIGDGMWLKLTLPETRTIGRRISWEPTTFGNDLQVYGTVEPRAVLSTRPACSGAVVFVAEDRCSECHAGKPACYVRDAAWYEERSQAFQRVGKPPLGKLP